MKVSFEGGLELAAALRGLGDDKALRLAQAKALEAGAEPVRDLARTLAPDDPATGLNPRQWIDFKRRPGKGTRSIVDVGIDRSDDPPTVVGRKSGRGTYRDPGIAGVSVMQEFGTDKMAANPYMRPAMDAELPRAPQRIGEALWPIIEKTAARLARKAARAK